jgi:hypothetical protein
MGTPRVSETEKGLWPRLTVREEKELNKKVNCDVPILAQRGSWEQRETQSRQSNFLFRGSHGGFLEEVAPKLMPEG